MAETKNLELKDFQLADMDRWLTENNITEIECLVPDLTGVARGKILPREKFSTDRAMRLPRGCFGCNGDWRIAKRPRRLR